MTLDELEETLSTILSGGGRNCSSLDFLCERLVELIEERKDNARLRGLIEEVEGVLHTSSGYEEAECPWCMGVKRHREDCPAFTPDGEVK